MLNKLTKSLLMLSLFGGAVALLPRAAQAQDVRTQYHNALKDLRLARAYLNDGWAWEAVRQQDNDAIANIDEAIRRIKQAAYDDGIDLHNHEPIDVHMSPHDRFGRAEDQLKAAHYDISQIHDGPENHELRGQTLWSIDKAEHIVHDAWATAHWQ